MLQLGDFFKSLANKLVDNLFELLACFTRFINREEIEKVERQDDEQLEKDCICCNWNDGNKQLFSKHQYAKYTLSKVPLRVIMNDVKVAIIEEP